MSGPELIYGLDEQAYHADTTTLSASAAKVLLGKRPPAPSDALLLGTLVHSMVLEPGTTAGRYVTLDAAEIAGNNPKTGKPYDHPTMTAKYKAAAAEAGASGKTVIAQSMWQQASAMAAALTNHREASRWLHKASGFEVSAYADHPTGARVRGRFDLVGPGFIADVKTCRDADPETFGTACHNFGYHISAANYLDLAAANGLDATRFLFLCVEKDPTPGGDYRVAVMELPDMAIDLGRDLMAEACRRWLDLGKRVDLPAYDDTGIHAIDLPAWAYPDIDLDLDHLDLGA